MESYRRVDRDKFGIAKRHCEGRTKIGEDGARGGECNPQRGVVACIRQPAVASRVTVDKTDREQKKKDAGGTEPADECQSRAVSPNPVEAAESQGQHPRPSQVAAILAGFDLPPPSSIPQR